jgi:hypothetical protein
MTIFGTPEQFAVEMSVDGRADTYAVGRISYIIGGRRVGDSYHTTWIGDYATAAPGVLCFRGQRKNEWLWQMSDAEAFRWIDSRLSSDDGVDPPEDEVEMAARHDATIWLDVFDEWKIYCIEHSDEEKLIFSAPPYDEVFSQVQPAGLFDRTVLEVFNRLNVILDEVERNESAGQGTAPQSVQPEQ